MQAIILVKNISDRTSEEDLEVYFSGYGAVLYAEIEEVPSSRRALQARIYMEDEEEAAYAIEELDGKKLHGHALSLVLLESEETEDFDESYDEDSYDDESYDMDEDSYRWDDDD